MAEKFKNYSIDDIKEKIDKKLKSTKVAGN